ncbi:MAG: DUF1553 domain-containing protein, partial [Planctomycetaceae bacterium]|nr:DUF1553 domain-containing protein [Planctomycetaceae bacterium]
ASNQPLLEALGKYFAEHDFSTGELIRIIADSHVYQLSSLTNERNAADTRNYSRHYRHRLRAEVLLDAFAQVSGVPQSFDAMPPGTTASGIWTHRTPSLFLDTFGRPDPNQDPPCERTPDSTVVQSLHLMNAQALHGDLAKDGGTADQLAKSDKSPTEITNYVYRLVYSRNPTDAETATLTELFSEENAGRRHVIEDIIWAMINSPEFVIQD